tara:strand:- start:425 stop:553 length:129 start_codon:yes stop_codon:yes gene_type:complete
MKRKTIVWMIIVLVLAVVGYLFIDSLNIPPLGPPEVRIDLQV